MDIIPIPVGSAPVPILIYTDSEYSIGCIVKWSPDWKRNGWRTSRGAAPKNIELIRACIDLMELINASGNYTVGLRWVKGHSNSIPNTEADNLAASALVSSPDDALSDTILCKCLRAGLGRAMMYGLDTAPYGPSTAKIV
jgi:ribonuclease HI